MAVKLNNDFFKDFYHYNNIKNSNIIKNRISNLLDVLYSEKKSKIFYKNIFWNFVKNKEKGNFYKSYDKDWDFYHKGYIGWHEYYVQIVKYEHYKAKRNSLIDNMYMSGGVERERRKKNLMNKLKYIARAKKWKLKGTKKWLKKANNILILKRYLKFDSKKKRRKFLKKRKINRKKINRYWERKAHSHMFQKKEEKSERSIVQMSFDHCDPFLPKWRQPRVKGKIKKINLKMERIVIKKNIKKKSKKTGFKKINIVKKLKKKKRSRRNLRKKKRIISKKKIQKIISNAFFLNKKKKKLF